MAFLIIRVFGKKKGMIISALLWVIGIIIVYFFFLRGENVLTEGLGNSIKGFTISSALVGCIIGGSMGGMQALQWCASYPQMVASAIPLATTMRHSALAIAFNEVARQAIMVDPKWNRGNYYDSEKPDLGLSVARMIGHVTYLSDEAMRRKFGRRLQNKANFSYGFDVDFMVESYLRYQGSKFVKRFDANSVLYITKAADYFDLVNREPPAKSIQDICGMSIKFLVISYTSDWLYPTYQAKELIQALKRADLDVSFCEIEADCGHDAFLIPDKRLGTLIGGFLDGVPRN